MTTDLLVSRVWNHKAAFPTKFSLFYTAARVGAATSSNTWRSSRICWNHVGVLASCYGSCAIFITFFSHCRELYNTMVLLEDKQGILFFSIICKKNLTNY
jgi:hypothetical protein